MEQDLYAAGYHTGYTLGELHGRKLKLTELQDLLCEVSDFLDNYTDAEYIDGRSVGNRAMNLKASIDELIG